MSVKYHIGELIDVFDPKDEIFCPASIVGVTYNKNFVGDIVSVRIHYLGSFTPCRKLSKETVLFCKTMFLIQNI
jgi:hypothetical protein